MTGGIRHVQRSEGNVEEGRPSVGAGHVPLMGAPLPHEGARAGRGDAGTKAAVARPVPSFQRPWGADGSGAVAI